MTALERIKCPAGDLLEWLDCYASASRLDKYLTEESFAHPAKMSRLLCDRIFQHLEKLGLLKPDSVVVDFMSGIGTTNLIASLRGYRTVGVELEPHFITMQEGNKKLLERKTGRKAQWEIITGDSRRLSEILGDNGGCGVVSPPYSQVHKAEGNPGGIVSKNRTDLLPYLWIKGNAGSSAGQIGNLPDKPLVGVVSPPYTAGIGDFQNKRKDFVEWIKNELKTKGFIEWLGKRYTEKEWRELNYGRLDGRVMVGSPKMGTEGYNPDNPSNIGNLKDAPLVGITSPPFMESLGGDKKDPENKYGNRGKWNVLDEYGEIPNKSLGGSRTKEAIAERASKRNIGQINVFGNKGTYIPQSYLSEMYKVYSESFLSGISPLVTVTKNPTRQGKLRRLDLDTASLLERVGYRIVDYHRAVLWQEHRQQTLDGGEKREASGRMSFFKRLSYEKGGIVAMWEDVLFAVNP